MLKVECESCKAPYQVDERRVPPTGLKMRCPKCGHTFLVTDPSKGAAPAAAVPDAAAPAAPKPGGPVKKPTMVGVGAFGMPPAPGVAQKTAHGIAPPAAPPPVADDFASLPAVKPTAPKPGAKPPVAVKPPPAGPPKPAPAAAPPGPGAFPGLDELDLPAAVGEVGLPAAVNRPLPRTPGAGPPPRPAAQPIAPPPPAAPPPVGGNFNFEVDLPAVQGHAPPKPPPPMPHQAPGFGSSDLLPSPKGAPPKPGGFGADLPSPKAAAGGFGDLPSPRGAPGGGFGDLPSPKQSGGGGGFGDIDLPSPKGFGGADLPSPVGGGFADLPSVQDNLPLVGGANNLPAYGGGNNLPSLAGNLPAYGGGNNLPSLAGNLPALGGANNLPALGGNLPAPRGGGGFGEIDLPSLQNDLPQHMGLNAHMPMPVGDDRLMPGRPGGAPAPIAFGELDLPLVGGQGGLPPQMPMAPPSGGGGAPVSFGELDLPADPGGGGGGGHGGGAGGMAFGEVDLGGGGGDGGPLLGPPPAASGNMFQEASLDIGGSPIATTGARPKSNVRAPRAPSNLGKYLGIAAVIIVGGGAALQFTPVGAFGHVYISDKMHAGEYKVSAQQLADNARLKLAMDTYAKATEAADDLGEARRRAPRNRALSAYAMYVELQNEIRFGGDASRASKAKTYISDIAPDADGIANLNAARAADQVESSADPDAGRKALEAAGQREAPNDGIQLDLAAFRGELSLQLHDAPGAIAAFTQAGKGTATARSQFGLARAYYLQKNLGKAKDLVDATIKLSPDHPGAHTLRGTLLWEMQRDDTAALKELNALLEPAKRKTEGPGEISSALSAKGWIMLARERLGEARTAFDESVKVDGRNALALVGQGEVLFADSRFTEALTRFDEAAKKDPSEVLAVIGGAKTKISLERLADAKTQLTAARTKWPKDMNIALWLARVESQLGNKPQAETAYKAAIDLADPSNPEAIQAYSRFAEFLSQQGRAAEAQAILDQAKAKLPDSPALQRAFGDVSATQGNYDDALAHYQAALAKNPNDLGTRFQLGKTERKMGKSAEAAKEFDFIAAVDREFPGISLERGQIFEHSGDVQKALEQFQSALAKAPNDVDLMLRVGAAYVAIGEVDKAMPLLTKVKDQRPNSAEANHFLGRAYLLQGPLESAAAMRYLQRAVELDPNQAEYHLYVAWAANEANPAQLGLARTHVDKALQLDKLLPEAYWQRGVVERREAETKDAIKDLKRALELKPSLYQAHATLAEAYEDSNDTAAATAEWAKAIASDDKQPTWRYHYGKLLLDHGNSAEAAKHLTFAVETGKSAQPRPGWLSTAAFAAGQALQKTGSKKEAIDDYCLYLELAAPTAPDRHDAASAVRALNGTCEQH